MTTGGGHTPLTESMAVHGIPSLTKKSFMSIEKQIGECWQALLEDSMKEAWSYQVRQKEDTHKFMVFLLRFE